QALERAQGWLKLPNGKALTGFNHEYKRHGTTTLFAALEVATGLVKAGHYRRRRRLEFLHFMNRVVAEHPGREMHVILDNLNTHKPKHDRWLARHKNVHFHFTPTTPPGSTRWKYGSPSSPATTWPAPASPRHGRRAIRSTPSP